MDATGLHTNNPSSWGRNKPVCKAYEVCYKKATPISANSLGEMIKLIPKERTYFQTQGTATGTKVAVAFANHDLYF